MAQNHADAVHTSSSHAVPSTAAPTVSRTVAPQTSMDTHIPNTATSAPNATAVTHQNRLPAQSVSGTQTSEEDELCAKLEKVPVQHRQPESGTGKKDGSHEDAKGLDGMGSTESTAASESAESAED